MIRPLHILEDLKGRICKIHPIAFKICDDEDRYTIEKLWFFQEVHVSRVIFKFIDQKPIWHKNDWHYCIEESDTKDWYWFPLNYLIICV